MNRFGAFLALLAAVHSTSALTTHAPKTNRTFKILEISSNCTSQEVRVRLEMNRNFRGVVYAKGFPLEKKCSGVGTGENFVEISISASDCGVRLVPLSEDQLSYIITWTVQTDRFLQQINDFEIMSTCQLTPNDMVHTRHADLTKHIRTGRHHSDEFKEEESLRKIRSWMEIEGTSNGGGSSRVSVGEQTLVLVKTILPGELSANVVNCFAHDGTNEVSQRLLDEFGCPLDESIMSSLETIKYGGEEGNEITWGAGMETHPAQTLPPPLAKDKIKKPRSRKEPERTRSSNVEIVADGLLTNGEKEQENTKMQVIGTMFSAFKFPDTSKLHLNCVLQICRHFCPSVTCRENKATNRTSKSSDFSSVIDRIEVFNSVEVLAPGIDSEGYSSPEDADAMKEVPGEKTFCLSASKMAFSFAILGAVFLCGVLAALWTIMRNQMRKMNKSYDGSEQILVVRDSPLNLRHPRNKPFTNWSYT